MKDELGERMKEFYENRTRHTLPRRTYTIIRLDGKAFHTYLRGFKRPYDERIMRVMDNTTIALCKQIQGAKMAFVQSDEISIVLTDFDDIKTDAWFDGNIQKIVSVSASIATVAFNNGMYLDEDILAGMDKVAFFDSRVFTIPESKEVHNYFVWRQQDATRNSIQMGAQSMYSPKELHGKNTDQLQELMFQKGTNWNDFPVGFKRGRAIVKEEYQVTRELPPPRQGNAIVDVMFEEIVTRTRWVSVDPPVFTADREFILDKITPKEKK
jgi:tRNA(His) guanylyltransferase